MNKIKYVIFLLVIFLITGCSSSNVYTANMFYMDTYINVKIYTTDKLLAEKSLKEVDKIYKEYHELSDRYDEFDNMKNIYYINHNLKVNESIKVDKKLYDLLKYSYDFCENSNGTLNIAMGHVIDIWKQYRDGIKAGVPTMDELNKSGSINLNDLVLGDNNTVMKKSDISLDLGAFAKGYVTEIAGKYLESVGLKSYIIDAGGNIKVGNYYKEGKYKIGVEKPTKDGGIYKIVNGNNIAVTTSGGYERFYEYDGKSYSHIIDEHTLFPKDYMLSVTVISKDSALADALDTMLFLMPIEDGIKYVNSLKDVEAVWYGNDNKIYYSEGFNQYE